MSETDLKKLKDLKAPEPRVTARRAAMKAAMQAFEASEVKSGNKADVESNVEGKAERQQKKPHPGAKGLGLLFRHTRISSDTERKPSMRVSHKYALAASFAALMIGAPVAFHLLQTEPTNFRSNTGVGGILSMETGGRSRTPPQDSQNLIDQILNAPPKPQLDIKADGNAKDRVVLSGVGAALDKSEDNKRFTRDRHIVAKNARKVATVAVRKAKPKTSRHRDGLRFQSQGGGGSFAGGRLVELRERSVVPGFDKAILSSKEDRDRFEEKPSNSVKQVSTEPVSTFSIDVDTASYSFVRRALMQGRLPPNAAVRVEEMINYFPYDYSAPDTSDVPFKPTVTVTPSPWSAHNKLVHIAIKGHDVKTAQRPRANLVFLIDVSGSMSSPDKLPLLKNAFRMLLDELQPDDTVALVTYASGSGVALRPTKVAKKSTILNAISALGAGGSTAGAQGIQDAYSLAQENFDKDGVNRIILATDGDFNVGVTDRNQLKGMIERKRKAGIFLSVLGFGRGNYNDALMQTLAQNGNGTAAYIDTLNEARKVLVDEASSTLFTIAKDVKIQVEFNPASVSEYRLIGYETRTLRREDFNNDKIDAGDIGSGHTVTAIYEVTPVGSPKLMDDLRYQKTPNTTNTDQGDVSATQTAEIGFLKLRYKLPKETSSKLITVPIVRELEKSSVESAGQDVRFSIAVAAFGQLLRGSVFTGQYSYADVLSLARGARGDDTFGYRSEFLNLVRLAKSAKR
ncbi:MAG: vWA domain-containing protein [Hyphomicrobiaceae bacterium]